MTSSRKRRTPSDPATTWRVERVFEDRPDLPQRLDKALRALLGDAPASSHTETARKPGAAGSTTGTTEPHAPETLLGPETRADR